MVGQYWHDICQLMDANNCHRSDGRADKTGKVQCRLNCLLGEKEMATIKDKIEEAGKAAKDTAQKAGNKIKEGADATD